MVFLLGMAMPVSERLADALPDYFLQYRTDYAYADEKCVVWTICVAGRIAQWVHRLCFPEEYEKSV